MSARIEEVSLCTCSGQPGIHTLMTVDGKVFEQIHPIGASLPISELRDTPFDWRAEILRVFGVPAIDLNAPYSSYARAMEQYRRYNGAEPGPHEKHTALIRRPTTALARRSR